MPGLPQESFSSDRPAPAPPGARRRAVIDVGTNSVKLLVGDVVGFEVRPVLEQSEQTRLGSGFYETRRLQPAAIAHTAEAVTRFAAAAHHAGVPAGAVRTIATSAARDALNQSELREAIRARSGCTIEIITGNQEAEWAFRGVTTDPRFHGQRLLILDVGGGSTEFILGEGEHHSFRQSFPLGSVRLFELLGLSDPPLPSDLARCRDWLRNFFNAHLVPALESLLAEAEKGKVRLVGTGGATTILARMETKAAQFDRDEIESVRLTTERVERHMETIWRTPLDERRKIVGIPPNRADIVPFGVAICEAVLAHFHFTELNVSTRGLRFGALLDHLRAG